MIITHNKLFFFILLLLLGGCSKIELHFEKNVYQEAKASQQSKLIIESLHKLTVLNPDEYQGQLDVALMALTQLEKAKTFIAKKNFYQAYLAGHDSYRSFPTKESKAILIESGIKIRYLLDVQSNIAKSFQYLPKSITQMLLKYENQPVLEWDVIEVNAVIGKLGKAAKVLNSSLTIIEREKVNLDIHEVNIWQAGINSQLAMINKIQTHLINIALCSSANMLEKLNVELMEDSTNLLSLVRESLAAAGMRPHFIKAQRKYEPYANLTVNLSLASSLTQRNTHAKWYGHWKNIEEQVLEGGNSLSNYPLLFSDRVERLRVFKGEAKKLRPIVDNGFSSIELFMSSYNTIYDLIEKLNKDRMILIYGSSSA